jgi:hypothetical protein
VPWMDASLTDGTVPMYQRCVHQLKGRLYLLVLDVHAIFSPGISRRT